MTIEIDSDFDADFYEQYYPETKDYYPSLGSKQTRLFHHYMNYGKNLGFYKNLYEINKIYIRVKNGLANRLRTLNSFYNFAIKNNKIICVCWESGEGWSNEKFQDLFEEVPDIKFISTREYNQQSQKFFNLEKFVYKDDKNPNNYILKIPSYEVIDKIKKNSFCYFGDSCLEYMFEKYFLEEDIFLKKLKPKSIIQYKINECLKSFNENTIGVHIRRGDAWNSPWKSYFQASSDSAFEIAIDKELLKNKNTKIFLSTDCKKTKNYFCRLYPNKIIVNNKKFFKSENYKKFKPYQDEAVVDLFLLSKTKKIIGSNWSSFSSLSSKINNKPFEIAKIENKIQERKRKKVSVICAVKDREKQLRIALSSWLNFEEINEIIIVDWSSTNPIEKLSLIDDRIKIIRVENEKYFNISKSYNLALKYATNSLILKMDADYVLNPYYNFFDIYNIEKNQFLVGHYSDKVFDNNCGFLEYLSGFIFTYKKNIMDVGGYNESFEDYGYDDCDLYNRLSAAGLERIYINHNCVSIFHTPHSDQERYKNYRCQNIKASHEKNKNKTHLTKI